MITSALSLLLLSAVGQSLAAQSTPPTGLTVQADLILHPTQMAQYITADTSQLNATTTLNLPDFTFATPYKTTWSGVTAKGPFQIQFNTANLNTQELAFTLTWASPSLTVNSFALNDTIHTTVSGVPVTVNVNMACSGMTILVPGGNWVVNGKLRYDLTTGAFVPTWESFQFQMGAQVAAQVNMGQCQGPSSVIPTVQSALVTAAANSAQMQSILQPAILNWVQSSLGSLQTQLLTSRTAQLQPGLNLLWQPAQLSSLTGGLIRVAGNFLLSKDGATVAPSTLARNYTVNTLSAVTQTEFILPHTTVQTMLNYIYSSGALTDRVPSTSIAAFQTLEQSRFEQFFAFPDLMNFATNALFYFDVTTSAAPQLDAGWILDAGGSAYSVQAPMLVHQWAPYKKTFLPYVDFSAPVTGTLTAVIKSGMLNLAMAAQPATLTAKFRPEDAATHSENTYIDTTDISTSLITYINQTTYSVAVPVWSLGASLNLEMSDLQVWNQTFRIPLSLVPVSK